MTNPQLGFIFTAGGYIIGSLVFYWFSRSRDFNKRDSALILLAGLFGGIFGAKITRVLFAATSGVNPVSIFTHPDGRTIVGGILFGWLAVEIAKKRLKITRSTGDGFALALCIGEAIGRIGCFFNGCCYGAPANLPWSVFQSDALRHPAQLYSAFFAAATFALLMLLRTRVKYEGDLFRIYLICWGSGRFFLEFVRERTDIHFGLSVAQWVSVEIVAAMIVSWMMRERKLKRTQQAVPVQES